MKKQLSTHAACAKAIRTELKKVFPTVKFSVTSECFSMGDAVRISWMDGVTTGQVDQIIRKYQYGTFDGMTDSYNHTNKRDDIPQVKFVQTSRDISEHALEVFAEIYRNFYQLVDVELRESSHELHQRFGYWTLAHFTRHKLWSVDLAEVAKQGHEKYNERSL